MHVRTDHNLSKGTTHLLPLYLTNYQSPLLIWALVSVTAVVAGPRGLDGERGGVQGKGGQGKEGRVRGGPGKAQ